MIIGIFIILKNFWFPISLATTFFIFDFVGVVFKIVTLGSALFCVMISESYLVKQKNCFF